MISLGYGYMVSADKIGYIPHALQDYFEPIYYVKHEHSTIAKYFVGIIIADTLANSIGTDYVDISDIEFYEGQSYQSHLVEEFSKWGISLSQLVGKDSYPTFYLIAN